MQCKKSKKTKVKIPKVVDFLKVISEENRLMIICILNEKEKCVCEILEELELPQNLVSHHLKVLKDFKILSSRKEGTRVFYKVNKKVIEKYLKLLNQFLKI